MTLEVVKILDTTVSENGPEQTISAEFLRGNTPLRMHIDLAAGDTIIIQGRCSQAHSWDTLHSFTDEEPADVYPSPLMRAIRSVDGTTADTKVYVANPFQNLNLTTHT